MWLMIQVSSLMAEHPHFVVGYLAKEEEKEEEDEKEQEKEEEEEKDDIERNGEVIITEERSLSLGASESKKRDDGPSSEEKSTSVTSKKSKKGSLEKVTLPLTALENKSIALGTMDSKKDVEMNDDEVLEYIMKRMTPRKRKKRKKETKK